MITHRLFARGLRGMEYQTVFPEGWTRFLPSRWKRDDGAPVEILLDLADLKTIHPEAVLYLGAGWNDKRANVELIEVTYEGCLEVVKLRTKPYDHTPLRYEFLDK